MQPHEGFDERPRPRSWRGFAAGYIAGVVFCFGLATLSALWIFIAIAITPIVVLVRDASYVSQILGFIGGAGLMLGGLGYATNHPFLTLGGSFLLISALTANGLVALKKR